jgi:hypothetical protein
MIVAVARCSDVFTSAMSLCSAAEPQGQAAVPWGKRRKVPDSDMGHLQYLLCEYVKEVGFQLAFQFGEYKTLEKQTKQFGVESWC